MIDKLLLTFPVLSDPDRSQAIEPLGVADPNDARNISRPAMILLAPDGTEVWRFVSRDFADRLPEEEVLEEIRGLGLSPTTQQPPQLGEMKAGPNAMPLDHLYPYLRGARFASLAMGLRHGHLDSSIKEDSKAYVALMDRYMEQVKAVWKRKNR